jgi:hypothetical protein
MNRGVFAAQLNTAWKTVRKLELDGERVWSPQYSLSTASMFRGKSYFDTWQTCFKEQLYDFQLVDNSLLQFRVESFEPLKQSYVYYECPYRCLSYGDFLTETGFNIDDARDELKAEYEDYLTTCDTKETVTPLRYDHSPELYTEGLHPASHVHFGHSNQIRVGTKCVLVPLSFLLFVIRQCYPTAWQQLIGWPDAALRCRSVRDNLIEVDGGFWNPLDDWEMRLT